MDTKPDTQDAAAFFARAKEAGIRPADIARASDGYITDGTLSRWKTGKHAPNALHFRIATEALDKLLRERREA